MEENKKYRILGTLLYYVLRIISSTLKIEITNKYENLTISSNSSPTFISGRWIAFFLCNKNNRNIL